MRSGTRWAERRRVQAGFTLIELLVVIVILGILSAVVVFSVRGVTDKGSAAAYATDAQTLRTAEEAYCAQHGSYAPSVTALANAGLVGSGSGSLDVIETTGVTGACGTGATGPSGFRVVCNLSSSNNCSGAHSAGAAVRGGTLTVGESFLLSTTNVASTTSGGVHAWWETMYNGLLTLDEAGTPSPELATVVPSVANGGITNSGATYTLHLRNDVFWQDSGVAVAATANTLGNPTGAVQQFTSADVKFTFEKVLLKLHARTRSMAGFLAGYDAVNCVASSIQTPDAFTVVFNFSGPYAPFLQQLNVTEAAMNPAHNYPASGCPSQAAMDANQIGTGPFQLLGGGGLQTPIAGDAKVVRNPNYWKVGLPYLNAIIMQPYTDENARYNALTSGAVGWIWDTANSQVANLKVLSGFGTAATQSLGGGPNSVDEFIFNLWAVGSKVQSGAGAGQGTPNIASGTAAPHPIFSDIRVRQAVAEAIDRNAYLTQGRFNVGNVSQSPISSQIFGHASDIALPSLNLTDANNLLDAAGWNGTPRVTVNGTPNVRVKASDNSTPLTIHFLQGSATFNNQVASLKSSLQAVGIDLNVTTNFNVAPAVTATTDWFVNRAYDAYLLNYAQGYDPQIGVPRQYEINQISTSGTPNNAPGYRNPAVDADLNNAATTLDATARYNYYHDFQTRVVADVPYVWLIETPNVRGFSAKCTGFKAFTGLFAESGSCSG